MLAQTSKGSVGRDKSCRIVLAGISLQGPEIARLVLDFFSSPESPEGEPQPDFLGGFLALGRKLRHAIGRVITADHALFRANAAFKKALVDRDKYAKIVSRQIIAARGACNALLEDLLVQELGFDQRTAQDPVPLLVQADRIVEDVRAGKTDQSNPVFPGDDFTPAKYADHLEKSSRDLRGALDLVADRKREAEKAMLEKRAVTEEYDDLFGHGVRAFESYCRLVGKDELADRLRPSETRPGRTVAVANEADVDSDHTESDVDVVAES